MMFVQYSFVERREANTFANEPIELSPSLAVWAGILAMIASVAVVAIA